MVRYSFFLFAKSASVALPPGRGEQPQRQAYGLKRDFKGELDETWIASALDAAEIAARSSAIGNVAVWIVELRVVENVKELGAELRIPALAEFCVFRDRHVPVHDAGAAAYGALRVADRSERDIVGENRTIVVIEVIATILPRIERNEFPDLVRLAYGFEVEAAE
jgi:hypothetical protein